MKVLVCGSRHFSDTNLLYDVLDKQHKEIPIDCVVEGDARGADRIAGFWAKKNKIDLKIYPADWDKYGKAAGPIRNKQMLGEGPDLVIAFRGPNSRGTQNMIDQATRENIPVHIIDFV